MTAVCGQCALLQRSQCPAVSTASISWPACHKVVLGRRGTQTAAVLRASRLQSWSPSVRGSRQRLHAREQAGAVLADEEDEEDVVDVIEDSEEEPEEEEEQPEEEEEEPEEEEQPEEEEEGVASEAPAVDPEAFSTAEKPVEEVPAQYALNILWLDKSIGLAVDQVVRKQKSPITEYFFWPKTDAWEALNVAIEAKDWISERDRVLLLNLTTDIINFWQDETTKHTIEEAREKYPDVLFQGN